MHFFFPPFFHSLDSCPIPFPPPFLGRGGVRFPDFATFLCLPSFSSFFQPTCQFPSGAPKHSFKVVPPPLSHRRARKHHAHAIHAPFTFYYDLRACCRLSVYALDLALRCKFPLVVVRRTRRRRRRRRMMRRWCRMMRRRSS